MFVVVVRKKGVGAGAGMRVGQHLLLLRLHCLSGKKIQTHHSMVLVLEVEMQILGLSK